MILISVSNSNTRVKLFGFPLGHEYLTPPTRALAPHANFTEHFIKNSIAEEKRDVHVSTEMTVNTGKEWPPI